MFAFIRYSPVKKEDIDLGSLFSRLKGGINYLRQHPSIFRFGVLTYMLFAFTLVEIHVLLPRYVESFLKESGSVYASAEIFYSFGAILSGILVYRLLSKYNAYSIGFSTFKGKLVRSILYPLPVDFKFEQDSYKFVGFLTLRDSGFSGFWVQSARTSVIRSPRT